MWLLLRSTHEALLRGKDEEIALLRQQLKEANHNGARAMGMYQKSVDRLTEALTAKPAATRSPFRVRRSDEAIEEKPKTLNLRDVDPNDLHTITKIAMRELPRIGNKVNGVALQRKIASIQQQIREIAAQGPPKTMGTLPGNVAAMIQAAEEAGKTQAKAG